MRYLTIICLVFVSLTSPGFAQNSDKTPLEAEKLTQETTCKNLKWTADKILERAGYCNHDDDCVSYDFGCPFACATPINGNDIVDIATRTTKHYQEKCGHCDRKCAQAVKTPKCHYGRCTFE